MGEESLLPPASGGAGRYRAAARRPSPTAIGDVVMPRRHSRRARRLLPLQDIEILVSPPEAALVAQERPLGDAAKKPVDISEGDGTGPAFQRVEIGLIAAELPVEAARIEAASRQTPFLLDGYFAMRRKDHD